MSHDIRTPLNGIIGYLDLEDGNLQNQELLLQYRKNARVAANHLLSLINDVLNMSKLKMIKWSLHMKHLICANWQVIFWH